MTLQTILEKLRIKEKASARPATENVDSPETSTQPGSTEGRKTTKLDLSFALFIILVGIWQGQNFFGSTQAFSGNPPERLSECFSYAAHQSGVTVVKADYYLQYFSTYPNLSGIPVYYTIYFIDLIGEKYNDWSFGFSGRHTEPYYPGPIGVYEGEYGNWPSCAYSPLEVKYHFDTLYKSLSPKFVEISTLWEGILSDSSNLVEQRKLKTEEAEKRWSLYDESIDYNGNISGDTERARDLRLAQTKLDVTLAYISSLETDYGEKEAKAEELNLEVKNAFINARPTIQSVADAYGKEVRWVKLKHFAINFILLVALLWYTLRRYFRAKSNQSDFSIIWAAIAIAFGILFLQTIIIFAYLMLPDTFIPTVERFSRELFLY